MRIIIIAGPNGAGKTTFAREFLPNEADCPTFINADLIAEGLSPFEPDAVAVRAGRLMLELIDEAVRQRKSFAFETTLSGHLYVSKIRKWRSIGYRVDLIYLSVASVELAIERIAERVRRGGHFVPDAVVRRRFDRGLRNLNRVYRRIVDSVVIYDNSGDRPVLVADEQS